MNLHNKKTKRIISSIICAFLIIAMILPMIASLL